MDDTAKAIARAREAEVPDKPTGPERTADSLPKRSMIHGGKGGGRPAAGGPLPSPSTKRPKQPGG
jgi:hypothetical protein